MTLKVEVVEKLNDIAQKAGMRTPSLIAELAERLDTSKDIAGLFKRLEVSKKIDEGLLIKLLEDIDEDAEKALTLQSYLNYSLFLAKRELTKEVHAIFEEYHLAQDLDSITEYNSAAFQRAFPMEFSRHMLGTGVLPRVMESGQSEKELKSNLASYFDNLSSTLNRLHESIERIKEIFGPEQDSLYVALAKYEKSFFPTLKKLEDYLRGKKILTT